MMDISRFRLSLYDGNVFIEYCNDAAVQSFGDEIILVFDCIGGVSINQSVNVMVDEL